MMFQGLYSVLVASTFQDLPQHARSSGLSGPLGSKQTGAIHCDIGHGPEQRCGGGWGAREPSLAGSGVNPEALTSKLKDEHEVAREMVGILLEPQEPRKSGSHLGTTHGLLWFLEPSRFI